MDYIKVYERWLSTDVVDKFTKEVAFEIIDGIPTLIKEYGPLHITYKFYLFGYFSLFIQPMFFSESIRIIFKHSNRCLYCG